MVKIFGRIFLGVLIMAIVGVVIYPMMYGNLASAPSFREIKETAEERESRNAVVERGQALQGPATRQNYVHQIETTFLKNGIDLIILADERGAMDGLVPGWTIAPQLDIEGRHFVGRPFVYQAMMGGLLKGAKSAGFSGLKITGYDQVWYFDLRAEVPSCDVHRSICK